ncbi:MAG: hypothetical protein HC915_15315 [Anaerolineae bacterium]|nr:hypothetical protein [Anaerolineae bacterium]
MRQVRSGPAVPVTVSEVAAGNPFYYDFSPDGQTMVWARFSRTPGAL